MNVKEIHLYSDIALASYGTFGSGPIQGQEATLRNDAGMSVKQVEEFAKDYSVVLPTFHDPVSDLDVTVFQDAAGNLTLGIHGTPHRRGCHRGRSTRTGCGRVAHDETARYC